MDPLSIADVGTVGAAVLLDLANPVGAVDVGALDRAPLTEPAALVGLTLAARPALGRGSALVRRGDG